MSFFKGLAQGAGQGLQINNQRQQLGLQRQALEQKQQLAKKKADDELMKKNMEYFQLYGKIIAQMKADGNTPGEDILKPYDILRQQVDMMVPGMGSAMAQEALQTQSAELLKQKELEHEARVQDEIKKRRLDAQRKELEGAGVTGDRLLNALHGVPMPAAQSSLAAWEDNEGNILPVDTRNREEMAKAATQGFKPRSGQTINIENQNFDPGSLNETKTKDFLFGSRMNQANEILVQLEQSVADKGFWGSVGHAVDSSLVGSTVGNQFVPEDMQKMDQAKRNFINAVLRRESGAVIADSEFDNANKQYFPLPGDSVEVVEQKRQNRELAIQNMLSSAGAPANHGKSGTTYKSQSSYKYYAEDGNGNVIGSNDGLIWTPVNE